ncbi:glycosyltransferase [Bradyrhizobium manausense]|uniref:glycosyltransferase n=1 Tax=Bradyrhizobium manausense TaxID=989370 RepID=UPI001BA757B1|nr:glycosyltransferase [Bradyrhizobium manausense]MBR0826163.1 glycosyltransferase [Bradyrhizobium manausense]
MIANSDKSSEIDPLTAQSDKILPSAAAGLRICHIAATTEGAVWVFEQLRDLRDRYGYDVSVILNGTSGALVDRFKAAGIPVLASDFQFLGSGDLFALPRRILNLARILENERFDVVQTHLFHSMVIGRIAAWLADVPMRLSMIAGPFHLEAYTPRWIDGSTQWMDTALIPSCEYSRTLYLAMGVRKERLEVIYYGPDETRFEPSREVAADFRGEYGWAPDTPLIGMVAYFYPELGTNRWTPLAAHGRPVKSHADLIRAMPAVLAEFPDAKLLLIGSGWEEGGRQYQARMQALVAELDLADNVIFTGYRTDIPAALKALDVAVQASVSENLGGSIEALLMEAPMVATRVGGLVDSVIDGKTGVLVGPADPAELARGILQLLRDRARARELGRRGRRLMLERFTLRKTVEDEHQLYQKLHACAPAGNRSFRRALRLIGGAVVGGYLAFRYRVFDGNLLPAWDAGWRPWHFLILRRLMLRAIDKLLRARQSVRATARSVESPVNEQFMSVKIEPPAPIAPRLKLAARMMLYRFYAFVGRQKFGWGLRARLRAGLRRRLGIGAGRSDNAERD